MILHFLDALTLELYLDHLFPDQKLALFFLIISLFDDVSNDKNYEEKY